LPVGLFPVESYFLFFRKYFSSRSSQITSTTHPILPHEGRIAIVTNAGLDAVDAAALSAMRSQGGLNLVSD
jgi:hypothetical protein